MKNLHHFVTTLINDDCANYSLFSGSEPKVIHSHVVEPEEFKLLGSQNSISRRLYIEAMTEHYIGKHGFLLDSPFRYLSAQINDDKMTLSVAESPESVMYDANSVEN